LLIYWWLEKNNKPKWWGTVSVALLFFVQIFSQIIVFVGAFDLVFDFRNLSGKKDFQARREMRASICLTKFGIRAVISYR